MSNITEPQTFLDLQQDFIFKMKESTTAAMTAVAKRFINIALVNMHRNPGANFQWPERRAVLITHAPYSTGTVTINTTTSRTAVTGAATAWTTATGFGFNNVRVGGKIKFSGDNENYIVSTVPTAGSLTLESYYMGSSISAAPYIYFEDEYPLAADFEEFVDMRFFSTDMEIPLIGRTDFRRGAPRNDIPGRPKVATHIDVDFSGTSATQHRVILNPYPDNNYQIPYWYKSNYLAVTAAGVRQSRLVNDTDEPVVPIGKRQGISLYAAYEYLIYIKDDVRAGTIKSEYVEFIKRIVGEKSASDAKPQFVARVRGREPNWGRMGTSNYIDNLRDFRKWGR